MQLSDPIENRILMALRRIMRAVDLHSGALARSHGLTGPQLLVLAAVARDASGRSIGALARDLSLSQPTVTGIVGRLEARGLVSRRRCSEDRRVVRVRLTHSGRERLADAPSPLQERFSERLAKLEPWEQTAMLSTLQRIVSMMDADELSAAPVLAPGQLTDDREPAVS